MTVTRTIVAPGHIADQIGKITLRAIAALAGATVSVEPPSLYHAGCRFIGTDSEGTEISRERAFGQIDSVRIIAINNDNQEVLGFLTYALGGVEEREPIAQPVPLDVMTEYRRLRDAVEEILDRGMTPGYQDWLAGSVAHLAEVDPGDVELPAVLRQDDPEYERIGRALYHARQMREAMGTYAADPEMSEESYAWANHLSARLAVRHEMVLERANIRWRMTPNARRVFDDLNRLSAGTKERISTGIAFVRARQSQLVEDMEATRPIPTPEKVAGVGMPPTEPQARLMRFDKAEANILSSALNGHISSMHGITDKSYAKAAEALLEKLDAAWDAPA